MFFTKTPEEIRALAKMQELEKFREKAAKLKPNEIPGFILQHCIELLCNNINYLEGELERAKDKEEKFYYAEGDYEHACNIRRIRLALVEKVLNNIINKKEPNIQDLAKHAVSSLQSLYENNADEVQKYLQENTVNFQMGLGRLATDLHLYITEFAKPELGNFKSILDQHQAYVTAGSHIRRNVK